MRAFGELVAGLDYPMYVVTVVAGERRAGCLAGFVTQASIDPARLLVCLSKANATFGFAAQAPALAVHFLGQSDLELARLFGEETGDEVDKFAHCRWDPGPGDLPILAGCRGWVAARILDRVDCGDHVAHLVAPFDGVSERPQDRQLGYQQVRDFHPGHPA